MDEIEKVEPMQFPIIDDIVARFSAAWPAETDPEKIKATYIGLFNSRKILSQSMLNGSPAELIQHIKILETIAATFTVCKKAAELTKIEFLNKASEDQKKAIAEEDKKYKPQFKEREAKQTEQEGKINKLVKFGMTRENAEKLIFGKPCDKCGNRICTCEPVTIAE